MGGGAAGGDEAGRRHGQLQVKTLPCCSATLLRRLRCSALQLSARMYSYCARLPGAPPAPSPPALTPRRRGHSQWKLAVRGTPDSRQRIQSLLAQLQPIQRPLAIYQYEKPTAGLAAAVTGDTVYEPVPYHFKIPHGLFMREATSVAVDSDDNVYVFNRGNMPMLVFDPDGNCIDHWGNPTPNIGQGVIVGALACPPTASSTW